ncbi:NUMOD4 motif-containing HNH endonuclease [Microbacterium sp. NPDC088619]|uniref:NUMOD4 motif-containing HNH endonuclease n=1 Tax=Microbacterium sp. NPDC088619 TaxID=3364196 RepID=UPI003813CB42
MDTTRRCSVSDCSSPVSARGWCSRHYHRWHRTGSPVAPASPQGESEDHSQSWRPVVGFEGIYEVSDQGNIRSLTRIDPHPRLGEVHRLGKRRSLIEMGNGYMRVMLSSGGKKSQVSVHRVVLEAFVGPCPPGMEACHANGIRGDNRLSNLRWDTRVSNAADRAQHGNDWQKKKTHCPQGHPYTGDNLVLESAGARRCRTCKRASDARYSARDTTRSTIDDIAHERL